MKLTFFLIVIGVFQSIASGMAQTISLRAKDMTLVEAMRSIQQQSGHRFFLNGKNLAEIRVDADLKDVSLAEAMNVLLQNKPAEWLLENETIVIKNPPSDQIPLIVSLPAGNATLSNAGTPQEHVVTGSITDERGEPLMGVTISVKGSRTATMSDNQGVYTITMDPGSTTLVYSMLGYETVEERVGTRRLIDVHLFPTQTGVDEVVVLGYGTSTRRTITDAVTKLDSTILADNASSSLIEIIQGQVPGMMTMMGDGTPGEEPLTIIRGVSSLEGNLGPLIVIDDIPMDENFSFNDINPEDILSIDILKGASASSIYGSRGAGGVFMITTKGGLNTPSRINYRYSYGKTTLVNPLEVLNSDEFKMLFVESLMNRAEDAMVAGQTTLYNGLLNYGTHYNTYVRNAYWGEAETNWMDLIHQPSVNSNHNLSITGNGRDIGYSVGLGAVDNVGLVRGSGFKRYSINLKLDSRQYNFVHFGVNLMGSSQDREAAPVSLTSALLMRPDMPAYNPDGTLFIPPASSGYRNPLAEIEGVDNKTNNLSYRLGGYIQFNLPANFTWKTLASINSSDNDVNIYYGSNTAAGSNNWSVTAPRNGRRISRFTENDKYEIDSRLSYRNTFARDHFLDAVVAFNVGRTSYYTQSTTIDNFPEDGYLNAPFHGKDPFPTTGSAWASSLASFVFRANYNYKKMYLLTLSLRRDGTSRMSPGTRYADFPSAAVAWNVGDYRFVKKNLPFVRMFKPRASFGKLANASVPPYGWLTTFDAGIYDGEMAMMPKQISNDVLRWETSTQYDVGIDFSFFRKHNLQGSVNYYHKMTRGALSRYNLPLSSGIPVTSTMVNLADIQNQGFEFDLQWTIRQTRNWNWKLSGNIARNFNKLMKLDRDITRTTAYAATIFKVGEPLGLLYGFETQGLFQSWEEVNYYNSLYGNANYQPLHMAPGEVILVDQNDNGWVDHRINNYDDIERRILGNTYPTYFGGLSTQVRYKSFSLSMQGSFSLGASKNWRVMQSQFMFAATNPKNLLKLNLDRWTPDNPNDKYPKMLFNPGNSSIGFSRYMAFYFTDQWVYRTDYFRINNLKLNYSVDKKTLSKYLKVVSRLDAGFTVNNLITFTKYPGVNPESYSLTDRISGPSQDNSVYPKSRTYNLLLNVTF